MKVLEPKRSRLYIAAGVVLAAGIVAAPPQLPHLSVVGLGLAMLVGGHILQNRPGNRRRQEFTVGREAFLALPVASPGLNVLVGLLTLGIFVAILVRGRESSGEIDPVVAGGVVVMAALEATLVFWAWRPSYVALTPQGVVWRSAVHRCLVPWDALAPGGPPTPDPLVTKLTLAVTRPEAVTVKGLARLFGRLERPVISGQFDVHPQLMAAAIRWYVQHPQDRAAIGTPAGHESLLAAAVGQAGQERAVLGEPNR